LVHSPVSDGTRFQPSTGLLTVVSLTPSLTEAPLTSPSHSSPSSTEGLPGAVSDSTAFPADLHSETSNGGDSRAGGTLTSGAVAGIVIAILALLALVTILLLLLARRRRGRLETESDVTEMDVPVEPQGSWFDEGFVHETTFSGENPLGSDEQFPGTIELQGDGFEEGLI
jgi:hypothetical protein